jgi:hypothetical protein
MRRLAVVPILAIAAFLAGQAPVRGQGSGASINTPKLIHVEPAAQSAFPVPVAQAEALPRNVFLRIRGLPSSATLSEGRQIVGGSWAVPLSALSTLTILVPAGSDGEAEITMSLETVDGRVLTAAKSTLLIAPASTLADDPSKRSAPVTIGTAARETTAPAEKTPAPLVPQLTPELPHVQGHAKFSPSTGCFYLGTNPHFTGGSLEGKNARCGRRFEYFYGGSNAGRGHIRKW